MYIVYMYFNNVCVLKFHTRIEDIYINNYNEPINTQTI